MGRKIKSIVLLVIVLVLIYCQHSEVIYAEEEGSGKEGAILEEEGDSKEEDAPEEGEDKEEIKKYEVRYREPDGRNGYYITVPEIEVCHESMSGKTVYQLQNNGEIKTEGELTGEGETIHFTGDQLGEGSNVLILYMEDGTGERIEEYTWSHEFPVDTTAPVFDMSTEAGFDNWYQKEAWLYVAAEDGSVGSGVESISCYCGNEIINTVKDMKGEFLIDYASVNSEGVDVTVTVVDKAGHRSEQTRKMYIDNSMPRILVEGVRDYMITSQPTLVNCKVLEDNRLSQCKAEIEWENPDGKKQVSEGEWTDESGEKTLSFPLENDGIYRMKMSATDMAGYSATQEMQVILDTQDPMIRYVDELEGKYMQTFQWNYRKDAFIQDFTSYVYQMQLDGNVYVPGTKVSEEGRHLLRLEVVDAAGNKSEAEAGFVIDRTPPQVLFLDIEENGEYEEEKTFKITLQDPEDKVQEIKINGVSKTLDQRAGVYEYTVQEHKNYEVMVKAGDKAGNESMSRLMFEVVPEETIFEKAVKPVRKLFSEEEEKTKAVQEKGTDDKCSYIWAVVIAGSVIAGTIVWNVRRYRKKEKVETKE